jgi:hypothetical protein
MTHNVTLEECKAIVTALSDRGAIVYDEKLRYTDNTSHVLHGLVSRWREELPKDRKEDFDMFYLNTRAFATKQGTA